MNAATLKKSQNFKLFKLITKLLFQQSYKTSTAHRIVWDCYQILLCIVWKGYN